MYRRENRGPERVYSKLQFPLSQLTCTISGSQSAALHGLFFRDSEAGVDPGVFLGKPSLESGGPSCLEGAEDGFYPARLSKGLRL